MPYAPIYATAIFGETGVEQHYEFVTALGMDPTKGLDSGTSGAAYARKYNTLSLVSELPYWSHPDAGDEALDRDALPGGAAAAGRGT